MATFDDIFYQSRDGLRLHAREYGRADSPFTLLCMPGLTRNAADFEDIGEAFRTHYRIVAADQRGRGDSAWDTDASHYEPATYVQDMFTLIESAGMQKVVLLGTSLGGLMAMMMNAMHPGRFAGVILNDIGPEVNPAGLERIKGYVGKSAPVTSWADAVAQTRQTNRIAFPNLA
ncbi:MAG TPA: alpha/beta hydrolase, partial [Pseudomonadales bacterium]|nr:alpha/beta hydrolase [Pseudomonadales bacterium]